jgi:hypothetical protein
MAIEALLLTDFTVAQHYVFLRGKTIEADRATGVDLIGGDTNFCTQTILETVGKACRCIHHHG